MSKRSARGHGYVVALATLVLTVALLFGAVSVAAASITAVDSGFENGADGATLASPPWTAVGGSQHREYDSARAKVGSQSAWIQGPASATYGGAYETDTAAMTSDGAEVRFWAYFDTTNQIRVITGAGTTAATYSVWLRFGSDGAIGAYTNRTGVTGYTPATYTPIGTYTTGWTQYRVVYDFTSDTYTLSSRATDGAAWTDMKAAGAPGYGIPLRGTGTITASDGLSFRGYTGSNMWLDEIVYSDSGIQ